MRQAEPVRLAEGQVAASGAVLARAFADDPLFTHSLSGPGERERLTPPFMTAWTRYGLLFGVVDVTAGPVEASAIWLPPSAVPRSVDARVQGTRRCVPPSPWSLTSAQDNGFSEYARPGGLDG